MPRKRKPSYLLHKATGQARVRIDGKDHYLGPYGSPDSRERFEELVTEWLARNGDTAGYWLAVEDLALLYIAHAERYYRKDGELTSEVSCVRIALRHLVGMHGRCRARDFGPKKLGEVRQAMIAAGVQRKSINLHVGRIRRMFRWAVAEELIPVEIYQGLCTLPGLEEGRSEAIESEPVRPVPQGRIDAVRLFVSRQVWGLIQLQLATGARPGELLIMRGCDLNMSGRIWEYTPHRHKTSHHGRQRVVFIGPRAQAILREFLKPELAAYLFSPRDAMEEFRAAQRANRKTPLTPSQAARRPKLCPRKQPRDRYTTFSFRKAVTTACERAFGMPDELRKIPKKLPAKEKEHRRELAAQWRAANCWHPNQLRHNAGTRLRREAGIETARCVLGHASVATSEIYAEMDLAKARKVIAKLG